MANMFLALTNIQGESRDHAHAGEIEVHDWDWGLHNKASFQLTGDQAAQHTKVQHLIIHKMFDKSSPTLMGYCAYGKKIPEGTLTCRKNDGENQVEFLIIKLIDIKVNEVKWGVKGEDARGFPEILELSFLKVRATYQTQIQDGSLAGATEFPIYNIADPDKTD
jgi:type VI secretion system secreted protein Hcp